jgi:hypothetical protein
MNEVSELRRLVEDLAARVVAIEEGFVLDHAQYIAFGLTRSEAILLALLMKRKIASRAAGLAVLYGAMPADEPDGKILDIFVCRIRKALRRHGVGEIRTLQGVGRATRRSTQFDDAFEKQRAADADIIDVAAQLGAKLKPGKRERAGPCPRCGGDDRFSVNIAKQIFNCRGAGGGRVVDMVMHVRAVEYLAACEIITGEAPPARGTQLTAEAKGKSRGRPGGKQGARGTARGR